MNRRKFLAGVAPVAAMAGVPAVVKAQEKITWRLQSSWPKGVESQYHADTFAQKVTELSGGRLTIQSLTAGSIVGGLDVFDAVNQGVIDASHSLASYWLGKEPSAPMFAAIPLGMDPLQYSIWYYQKDGLSLWKEMYSKYNFGWVGPCGLNTAEDFLWSHKPIRELKDFDGLKIRTVGYWGDIVTKIGARVVTLPGGEIYGALDRKILDAAEFANPSADYVMGFHQVCKYVHVPGVHQPASVSELIINKKAWDSLTPELKSIVQEAAKATTFESWGHCIVEDNKAIAKFKEYGTEFVKLSPEFIASLKALADEYYAEKAKSDPFFARVFNSQQEVIKEYNGWAEYMLPPKI
ncbi:TRAP transporter substrate-binding protein DctP [Castellaniella sp. GW247-6E4]|uniref:TRAP transporter substrate-binding protein n=1 Tax=Castellaniella sp. GW247-6E4 TaxID=3140380 RepID=UPI003314FE99